MRVALVLGPGTRIAHQPAPCPMPTYFPAACRFSEYRVFALENIERIRHSRPSLAGKMVIYLSAAAIYWVKSLKVRHSEIAIGSDGIRRRSSGGERIFPWSEVKAVHKMTPGYLIELQRGAIPVPYRCISHDAGIRGVLAEWAGEL